MSHSRNARCVERSAQLLGCNDTVHLDSNGRKHAPDNVSLEAWPDVLGSSIRDSSIDCMVWSCAMYKARPSQGAVIFFGPSVASGTALGLSQLVHLGHALLELHVLAFLVAVPLLLTLPGQEVRIGPAPVEGDQEVGAAVPVLYGELRIAHLVAGRLPRHGDCFVVCHIDSAIVTVQL